MTREQFIKKRKYLFWYVKDPTKVSDEALVEAVLNLGDWDDVQKLIKLMGIKKVAKIFRKATSPKNVRTNYNFMTKKYFDLYFDKYCPKKKKNKEAELKSAINNLEKDGVKLEILETKTTDSFFTVYSKNWKTRLGVNVLGFWLAEQIKLK